MNRRTQRIVGITLICLSIFTVASTLWLTREQRETAECQAEYNSLVIQQIRIRSQIADGDRESLARLVREVVNSKSRQESREALARYLETKEKNDDKRAESPIPPIPEKFRC